MYALYVLRRTGIMSFRDLRTFFGEYFLWQSTLVVLFTFTIHISDFKILFQIHVSFVFTHFFLSLFQPSQIRPSRFKGFSQFSPRLEWACSWAEQRMLNWNKALVYRKFYKPDSRNLFRFNQVSFMKTHFEVKHKILQKRNRN